MLMLTMLVVQRNGLKMVTNLFTRMPSCLSFKGRNYHFGHFYAKEMVDSQMHAVGANAVDEDVSSVSSSPARSLIVTVRTFFPETWLWDMYDTG